MTKHNQIIAKYRVLGLVIIFLALFAIAFSVLLVQEQLQLAARAQAGLSLPR